MDTVKKIREALDRKTILENNIRELKRGINHVNMSDSLVLRSWSGDSITVTVSRAKVIPLLDKQIEADKADLAVIDKQLDAIGALMGIK